MRSPTFVRVLLTICCASALLIAHPAVLAGPPEPAVIPEGKIAGHVWLDANCDGLKDAGEDDLALAGIVQLIGTGRDRVLNPGDHAVTYYTDNQGNWLTPMLAVNDFLDNQPLVFAVAVGVSSAAALGFQPSPEGGDSILSGPTHASTTFQLVDAQTINVGEIGVCTLTGRILIPIVSKR